MGERRSSSIPTLKDPETQSMLATYGILICLIAILIVLYTGFNSIAPPPPPVDN